jgi:hypothetical protein
MDAHLIGYSDARFRRGNVSSGSFVVLACYGIDLVHHPSGMLTFFTNNITME